MKKNIIKLVVIYSILLSPFFLYYTVYEGYLLNSYGLYTIGVQSKYDFRGMRGGYCNYDFYFKNKMHTYRNSCSRYDSFVLIRFSRYDPEVARVSEFQVADCYQTKDSIGVLFEEKNQIKCK